jgi:hypothetical protein
VLAATITEHQAHTRICPCCGCVNRGRIPPEIRAYTIGPRLVAAMSYLSGRHHLGRWAVEEVVETVFEVPTSLGSIAALEAETSDALAGPYQEAGDAVREAPVKNTDETSWSEKGQKRWLWTAATATVAFFVIHLRRNFQGLQALLGEMGPISESEPISIVWFRPRRLPSARAFPFRRIFLNRLLLGLVGGKC